MKTAITIFLVFSLSAAVPALAADYYVATTGSDASGDGSAGNPWKTIAYAISQVVADDVIHVAAGTYDEYIVIQKGIDLIGAGSGVTTLTNTHGQENVIFIGSNSMPTYTEGIIIEGFTLRSTALTGDKELLNLRASGSVANPIIIRNNVFDGVAMDHSVTGIETPAYAPPASNFQIEANQFINELRYCIWLNTAVDVLIKDNTFTDAKYSALAICTSDLDRTHDIEIVGNTILRSTSYPNPPSSWYPWMSGMHIGSTCYNMNIHKNTIADGAYYGIIIHDRNTTALANFYLNCNDIHNNGLRSMN